MKHDRDTVDRFYNRWKRLCLDRSHIESYQLAERWEKHFSGRTLYSSYDSFRVSVKKRLISGSLNRNETISETMSLRKRRLLR